MIEDGHGNLLTADTDALVNTVNTVGVMGKGIALQFKRAYPENFRSYQAACKRGEVRLGRMFVVDRGIVGPRRYIINFPTKKHWRNPSKIDDIRAGLADLVDVVSRYEIGSIAIPALGCGNGGLDWAEIRPMIEDACRRMPQIRAVIFAPEGAPPPESMPDATPRPKLTDLRALLVAAIGAYLDRARLQEFRDGISELEVQKLAYLLQIAGAPLNLKFVRGRYGPYSESLTRVLATLEGHFLTGLGDRSARVTEFAPIKPLTGGYEAASESVKTNPKSLSQLNLVLDVVDGFESPYSLELLATVHFAAAQPPPTGDVTELTRRVTAWSLRKARLFTDAHVQLAAARLAEHRLLPD
ncbi:macro domain-containing protein [Solwaraspora sp. WMMD406]|uniref:type II toxin-antitoxin system antitoxin DNA ADP-ribosyl glycohydrolase DarG n=1 Tax=Solwaraspora sp. WMMD406 TaxID=3016095 RepID=UPI002415F35F|nr:macro domain-containing protein [Solwaraspora sp. WMMD406]MDG4764325.1 macro domain-containing protein [Solwaraspora sp. WMMD406]